MELTPEIFRTIVFIRHGQYASDPEKLTPLGRKQAKRTASAVAQLKPSKIFCSTMPRAIETASLISEAVDLKALAKDFFREGLLPGTVAFRNLMTKGKSASERKNFLVRTKHARKNANLAFQFLFKKPKRGQATEVVVAHGNVIRYWVCKALDIPEDRWLKMDIRHASLTTLRVSKKGNIVLLGFSDTGHLPLKMRTFI